MNNTRFWNKIAVIYAKVSGQPVHKTLSRTVSAWMKERRQFLELLESGEQDTESSYTNAIDEWIIIDDVQKRRKEEIKERQGRADKETKQSLQWR